MLDIAVTHHDAYNDVNSSNNILSERVQTLNIQPKL